MSDEELDRLRSDVVGTLARWRAKQVNPDRYDQSLSSAIDAHDAACHSLVAALEDSKREAEPKCRSCGTPPDIVARLKRARLGTRLVRCSPKCSVCNVIDDLEALADEARQRAREAREHGRLGWDRDLEEIARKVDGK